MTFVLTEYIYGKSLHSHMTITHAQDPSSHGKLLSQKH